MKITAMALTAKILELVRESGADAVVAKAALGASLQLLPDLQLSAISVTVVGQGPLEAAS